MAINEDGTGPASNVITATALVLPPGAPTGLTASPDGKTGIDLKWTAPTQTGFAAITGYKIEVSNDGTANSWTDLVANTGSSTTTYSHTTGLIVGDTRHYRVSAINSAGPGTASASASATVKQLSPPGRPTNMAINEPDYHNIYIHWLETSSDGGTPITGYHIEISTDDGTTFSDLVPNTSSTSTTYAHT